MNLEQAIAGLRGTFLGEGTGRLKTPDETVEAMRLVLNRPTVAYRVKDYADGWILVHTEKEAKREASGGNTIQELVIK